MRSGKLRAECDVSSKQLTTHLVEQSDGAVAENGRTLSSLLGEEDDGSYPDMHPGLVALMSSVELRIKQIQTGLMHAKPTNEGAAYANAVGEMRGLRSIEGLAKGVVVEGLSRENRMSSEEAQSGS